MRTKLGAIHYIPLVIGFLCFLFAESCKPPVEFESLTIEYHSESAADDISFSIRREKDKEVIYEIEKLSKTESKGGVYAFDFQLAVGSSYILEFLHPVDGDSCLCRVSLDHIFLRNGANEILKVGRNQFLDRLPIRLSVGRATAQDSESTSRRRASGQGVGIWPVILDCPDCPGQEFPTLQIDECMNLQDLDPGEIVRDTFLERVMGEIKGGTNYANYLRVVIQFNSTSGNLFLNSTLLNSPILVPIPKQITKAGQRRVGCGSLGDLERAPAVNLSMTQFKVQQAVQGLAGYHDYLPGQRVLMEENGFYAIYYDPSEFANGHVPSFCFSTYPKQFTYCENCN